jgi:methylenetetrahydrofolate reductase (NADPH)
MRSPTDRVSFLLGFIKLVPACFFSWETTQPNLHEVFVMVKQNSHLSKLSFEFFPPKDGYIGALEDTAKQFRCMHPEYFSITSGAGGSKPTGTLTTALSLRATTQIDTVPHLACVGSTKEKIRSLLKQFQQNGIHRLVALRGDLLNHQNQSTGDFRYARDLVAFIREETGNYFYIYVAAYPEFHPEVDNVQTDLQYFKDKIDAGANAAITQYFFNIDAYFRFIDNCSKLGITIPIIPGIMPIFNYQKLVNFSELCGAEIPRWLRLRLENHANDNDAIQAFGCDVTTELCTKLLLGGAHGLHFYTLNKLEPTNTICRNLSLAGWRSHTQPVVDLIA